MIIQEADTEQLILEAAKKVFFNKGFDGARMQEIADVAGINKALLHYYFRSKDKLFEAIFFDAFQQFIPRVVENMNADIVIASSENGNKDLSGFFQLNPENILLVMHKGNIRLADERIVNQLTSDIFEKDKFSCIKMNAATKFVQGDLTGLVHSIRKYYPAADIPFTIL